MKDIIIDTDPGNDDALAIMLAIKSNRFNVNAITTVAGNSNIKNTTRNARYILKLLNREDIPVYSGSSMPLKRNLIKAVVQGKKGLEGINPNNKSRLTNNAIEKIIEIVKKKQNEITIIALGPLTNIAKAIKKSPKTMKKINQIVIMGGAIKVPGNKNRVAEFNIFVDPEAADIVFKFPIKKILVPLDVCNNVKMRLKDFKKIKNKTLRKPILKMMKPYINNIYNDEGIKAALVYDALAVYYALNPKKCIKKNYNLIIETIGKNTRGMTIADLRIKKDKPNISVVEKIQEKQFKKDFIKILSRDTLLNLNNLNENNKGCGK